MGVRGELFSIVVSDCFVGVNWSPSPLHNPFRSLGPDSSLEALLAEQRAGRDNEPIVLALHLASPRIAYTDKAKSALELPDEVSDALVKLVEGVTSRWAKVRKAEERDELRYERRQELMTRQSKEKQRHSEPTDARSRCRRLRTPFGQTNLRKCLRRPRRANVL